MRDSTWHGHSGQKGRHQRRGRSAASGARQKLTELRKTIQTIPMEEPQTGVALTPKSLARGRLVLSPQEQMALRNQAEAFLRFLEETGCPEAH